MPCSLAKSAAFAGVRVAPATKPISSLLPCTLATRLRPQLPSPTMAARITVLDDAIERQLEQPDPVRGAADVEVRLLDGRDQTLERRLVLERDHHDRVGAAVGPGAQVRLGAVALALGMIPAGEVIDLAFLEQLHHAIDEEFGAYDKGHFHG